MPARPAAIGAALVLALASLAAWVVAWNDWGVDPRASAGASTVVFLIGFLWLAGTVLLWIVATSLVRALRMPNDPRTAGVVAIGALLGYYLAAAGTLVLAFLYLWPMLF